MDCSGMPSLKFILGERKYVWFKITSCVDQIFTIASATWELKHINGTVAAYGDCELDGTDILRVLLEPVDRGTYILCVSYLVPPELKKAQVNVNVT